MTTAQIPNALEIAETHYNNVTQECRQKMTEIFRDMISGDYEIIFSNDSTKLCVRRDNSNWSNDLTIYHYYDYNDKPRQFKVNWFASTLDISDDTYNYAEYLVVLGKTVDALKNGLADTMQHYLDKIETARAEYRTIERETDRIRRANEINSIREMFVGTSGEIVLTAYTNWYKSGKTSITFDKLSWAQKRSGNYSVFFSEPGKTPAQCTTVKMTLDELIHFVHQRKDLLS